MRCSPVIVRWIALAACLAAAITLLRPAPASAQRPESWDLCRQATTVVETLRDDLPRALMAAMSKVESGRAREGHAAAFAWPWTIHAEGRGRYLPTKAAAVSLVERLQRRGVSNIDVGCMQVNLYYHGHAFDSVAQAFDPVHNIAYAAEFLLKLRRTEHSWIRAIRYYHSRTPEHYLRYHRKVREAWRQEKRLARQRARDQLAQAD
jgi:soluble lytic murein transglycosylase-like protein